LLRSSKKPILDHQHFPREPLLEAPPKWLSFPDPTHTRNKPINKRDEEQNILKVSNGMSEKSKKMRVRE
jgi:hypothetical protein